MQEFFRPAVLIVAFSLILAPRDGNAQFGGNAAGTDLSVTSLILLDRHIDDLKEELTKLDATLRSLKHLKDRIQPPGDPAEAKAALEEFRSALLVLSSDNINTRIAEAIKKYNAIPFNFSPPQRRVLVWSRVSLFGLESETPVRGNTIQEILESTEIEISTLLPDEVTEVDRSIDKYIRTDQSYADSIRICRLLITDDAWNTTRPIEQDDSRRLMDKVSNCLSGYGALLSNSVQRAEYLKGAFDTIQRYLAIATNRLDQQRKGKLDEIGKTADKIQAIQDKSSQDIQAEKVIPDSAISVIEYTLIAWAVIIIGVIIAILVLSYISRISPGRGRGQVAANDLKSSYAMFLDMMTIFLLTGAILILGLGSKIDKEGLAALIGGISGYVLGRMGSPRKSGAEG
jgi:uncharacterized small protein (DUF1192 family)